MVYQTLHRVLWVAVTAAAIWGAVDISLGQLQRYNDNPTVVALEKDFRSWRFSIPAITACLQKRVNPSKLPEVIKNLWNTSPEDEKYSYYARFVHAVAESNLFMLGSFEEFENDPSLDVDMYQLAVDVMTENQLKPIFSEPVDPIVWIPVMTESGACYSANSLAIDDIAITELSPNYTEALPLTCRYASLTCYLILEMLANCSIYTHSPYDISDASVAPSDVILTLNRITVISVMETRAGKGVRELKPKRRGCLYTDEPTNDYKKVYSTNTCRLTCRNKLAIELCGCRPFYYRNGEGPICTPAGMACLSRYPAILANNNGQKCSCAQQCVDSSFKELSTDNQYWDKGPFVSRGSLRYTVQAPRTRYSRQIIFHFQDLIVSFGGAAGLFLGASFISFVEIFYFFVTRVLGLFCGEEPKKAVEVKLKHKTKPTLPYEELRIMTLNKIIAEQDRYEKQMRFSDDIYRLVR